MLSEVCARVGTVCEPGTRQGPPTLLGATQNVSRDPAAPTIVEERELNQQGIFTKSEAGEITTPDGRTLHFDAKNQREGRVLVWEHDAREAWERYARLAEEVAALFYTPLEACVVGALLQVPECEGYALLVSVPDLAKYLGGTATTKNVSAVLERLENDGGVVARHVSGHGCDRKVLWGIDFAQLAAVTRMRLNHMLKNEKVAGADTAMLMRGRPTFKAEPAEGAYRCVGCDRRYREIDFFPAMVDPEHNVRCVTHGCNDVLVDERDEVDSACLANDAAESAEARRLVRGELQHLNALVDSAQALPAPRTLSPEEECVLEQRRRCDVDLLLQHRNSCAAEEKRRACQRAQGAHEMPAFLQGFNAHGSKPTGVPSFRDNCESGASAVDGGVGGVESGVESGVETTGEHEHTYVREEYNASTDTWTRYCDCGFSETYERM